MSGDSADTLRASVARIGPLAWPVLVGQVAVLMFATVDTILVARHSAADLAAYAVGGAVYITVFIGLMGVVLAVSPIVGQLYGAQRLREEEPAVEVGFLVPPHGGTLQGLVHAAGIGGRILLRAL